MKGKFDKDKLLKDMYKMLKEKEVLMKLSFNLILTHEKYDDKLIEPI